MALARARVHIRNAAVRLRFTLFYLIVFISCAALQGQISSEPNLYVLRGYVGQYALSLGYLGSPPLPQTTPLWDTMGKVRSDKEKAGTKLSAHRDYPIATPDR
jgi:hypothetical protein